jgi:hypothetical protein
MTHGDGASSSAHRREKTFLELAALFLLRDLPIGLAAGTGRSFARGKRFSARSGDRIERRRDPLLQPAS